MPVIGLCTGAFDLLHLGHKHFLTECTLNCDMLWVLVNTDEGVRAAKGKDRPAETLEARQKAVGEFIFKSPLKASSILCFNSEKELNVMLHMIRPDVVFRGSDYFDPDAEVKSTARVHYVQRLEGYSTTAEIAKRT